MTRSLRGVCSELEIPLGGVLEGGYALGALARSVAATLEVLGDREPAGAAPPAVGVSEEARRARERLREWWPDLTAAS
jgi:acetoin utilization deacetylase AcuC-like enzyme